MKDAAICERRVEHAGGQSTLYRTGDVSAPGFGW